MRQDNECLTDDTIDLAYQKIDELHDSNEIIEAPDDTAIATEMVSDDETTRISEESPYIGCIQMKSCFINQSIQKENDKLLNDNALLKETINQKDEQIKTFEIDKEKQDIKISNLTGKNIVIDFKNFKKRHIILFVIIVTILVYLLITGVISVFDLTELI